MAGSCIRYSPAATSESRPHSAIECGGPICSAIQPPSSAPSGEIPRRGNRGRHVLQCQLTGAECRPPYVSCGSIPIHHERPQFGNHETCGYASRKMLCGTTQSRRVELEKRVSNFHCKGELKCLLPR